MKDMIRLGLILFAIAAVAASALGATNQATAPIIADMTAKANDEARKIVLPTAKEFKPLEGAQKGIVAEVYEGLDNGNVVGYAFKTIPSGYGGDMEIMVGISADGKVTGINMGTHAETPGLGSKAGEPAFKDQFNGKSVEKSLEVAKGKTTADNQILAISGATISSTAVTDGVNAAIELYSGLNK
jgi:Na+-translocating ferredoxin:NAD+ oxidoreductase subunit G